MCNQSDVAAGAQCIVWCAEFVNIVVDALMSIVVVNANAVDGRALLPSIRQIDIFRRLLGERCVARL